MKLFHLKISRQRRAKIIVMIVAVLVLASFLALNPSRLKFLAEMISNPESRVENLTTNLGDYQNSEVPKYDKFELTFDLKWSHQGVDYDPINDGFLDSNGNPDPKNKMNPYWPYEANPVANTTFGWTLTETYNQYDRVTYLGTTYKALATNTGKIPSANPDLWEANPMDPVPPGVGITVTGIFLKPGQSDWNDSRAVVEQPGFYYLSYKSVGSVVNQTLAPSDNAKMQWKVRFAPTDAGSGGVYKYRIKVEDKTGVTVFDPVAAGNPGQFVCIDSNSRGFVKVSSTDNRYFETTNGQYLNLVGSENFTEPQGYDWNGGYAQMAQNGLNLDRVWWNGSGGGPVIYGVSGRGGWRRNINPVLSWDDNYGNERLSGIFYESGVNTFTFATGEIGKTYRISVKAKSLGVDCPANDTACGVYLGNQKMTAAAGTKDWQDISTSAKLTTTAIPGSLEIKNYKTPVFKLDQSTWQEIPVDLGNPAPSLLFDSVLKRTYKGQEQILLAATHINTEVGGVYRFDNTKQQWLLSQAPVDIKNLLPAGCSYWELCNNYALPRKHVTTLIEANDGTVFASGEFAGAGMGVFRSTDGEIWQRVQVDPNHVIDGKNFESNPLNFVTGIQFEKDGQGRIFLTTEGSGVLRSDDNGVTWRQLANSPANMSRWSKSLAINPQNGYVYATNNLGLNRSTDHGETWELVNSASATNSSVNNVAAGTDGVVYNGNLWKGLWISKDNGDHWNYVDPAKVTKGIVSMVVDDANNVYIATDRQGMLKSTDQGETWTAWNNGTGVENAFEKPRFNLFKTAGEIYAEHGLKFLYTDFDIREDLTPADPNDNNFGPNLAWRPNYDVWENVPQDESWLADQQVEAARKNNVYLKVILGERLDAVMSKIQRDGSIGPRDDNNFYGNNTYHAARNFQFYLWRYVIARWGYSTSIHSFEFSNENGPADGIWSNEYFAKYFNDHDPNHHMATTSLYHSFPTETIWGNPQMPDLAYADWHRNVGMQVNGQTNGLTRVFNGWKIYDYSQLDNQTFRSAPYALPFQSNGTVKELQSEPFSITPGHKYTLKWYQKADNISADGSFGLNITVMKGNVYGSNVAAFTAQNKPTGSYDWQQFSYSFTAGDGGWYLNLFSNFVSTSGKLWLDDLTLHDDTINEDVVVPNGNFDQNRVDQDTAMTVYDLGQQVGYGDSRQVKKPVVDANCFVYGNDGQNEAPGMTADTEGIWYRKFLWAQVNPYGLLNMYYTFKSIQRGDNVKYAKAYQNFMADIKLSDGKYDNAKAKVTVDGIGPNDDPTTKLRAWGQKEIDPTSGNADKAHLWFDNANYTWQNVVNGNIPAPVSGTVTLAKMKPNKSYKLEWWNTAEPDITQQIVKTEGTMSDGEGNITIPITNLQSDIALKITIVSVTAPTPAPHRPVTYLEKYIVTGTKSADVSRVLINGTEATVDNVANTWTGVATLSMGDNTITVVGQDSIGDSSAPVTVTINRHRQGDQNGDGKVEILDFAYLMQNWRKAVTDDNYLADYNEDNQPIEILDFAALMQNWDK